MKHAYFLDILQACEEIQSLNISSIFSANIKNHKVHLSLSAAVRHKKV